MTEWGKQISVKNVGGSKGMGPEAKIATSPGKGEVGDLEPRLHH